ncbi:mitochondrial intermembrane space import and assembly protein 40-like [Peromyscus leucopus]|uniref:mitochondrial intermembrane space import and assembly protein 40-like n=1 Tax=Peromyscus leucopus TaxID=10041 RepID=UPI0018852460|nr:mitochondrial intermembrane space import and assembly protein 40-like [Peromyscus leucopus]
MAYCRQEGKDQVVFVTRDDHEGPSNESNAELVVGNSNDPYEEYGLIMPNGEINWNCPCLGATASSPCEEYFKSAFPCFHNSPEELEESGSIDEFQAMQEGMQKYPDVYAHEGENEEDNDDFYEEDEEGEEEEEEDEYYVEGGR